MDKEKINKQTEQQYDKKLQTDLDVYLHFVSLYKKKRPKKLMQQIEQIINKENSTIKRIKKIDELDKQYINTEKTESKKIIKEKYSENNTKTKSYNITSPSNLIKSSLINYLFFERTKLINFARKTKTIDFKLLGLKKELSAYAIVFWNKLISDSIEILLPQINYVIINGWQTLEPIEYNLIKAFREFLNKFLKSAGSLDRNNSNFANLSIIDSFIDSYIRLISNTSYPNLIETSFYKIINNSKSHNQKLKKSTNIIKKFTNIQANELSFLNISISCYAVCYNKLITLNNISHSYKIKPINSEYHEFDHKTLNDVKKYMNKVNEKITEREDALFFINFIDETLDFNSDKTNKWVNLFYKFISHKNALTHKNNKQNGLELEHFHNDILKYLSKLTDGFLKNHLIILEENIKVITNERYKKVSIFDNSLFIAELTVLKNITKDYQFMHDSGKLMAIPFETYNIFQIEGQLEGEKENKLCQMIYNALLAYKNISLTLEKVLLQHNKALQESNTELLEKYKAQNKPISIIKDNEIRFIPHSFDVITHCAPLEKQKIIDIINQTVFFCLSLLYLLKEKDIIQAISTKEQLIAEIEGYLKLKAKIR